MGFVYLVLKVLRSLFIINIAIIVASRQKASYLKDFNTFLICLLLSVYYLHNLHTYTFLHILAEKTMCLSLPGRIISIHENSEVKMASVDFGGVRRDICIEWVPEAKVNDYVLAHVGTALTLMDEAAALENIAALNDISEKLSQQENKPN